jgi:hypothetical protein
MDHHADLSRGPAGSGHGHRFGCGGLAWPALTSHGRSSGNRSRTRWHGVARAERRGSVATRPVDRVSVDQPAPRGWLLPIVVAVAVALFAESAYVLAEQSAIGRGIFAGQLWAPHDVAQYVAAMNDGASGQWLIRDRLTAEPHAPAFIYGFYVVLGTLTQAVGISAEAGYRLAGVLGRIFVMLAMYRATSSP